jgi:predicted restriction endonuclease
MNIIYCNVGEMNEYNGVANDSIQGGGSYNSNHIGHEVNNFTNHNGTYYGFVQATNNTIDISANFDAPRTVDYADNILVVWIIKQKTVVGYYKNSKVFRKLQSAPDYITVNRKYDDYNIITNHAVLIPKEKRTFSILNHQSRNNVWYGDDENNQRILEYIDQYESSLISELNKVDDFSNELIGLEKETVIKQRINQGLFRDNMLKKYNCKCALCGVNQPELLIASHIKPWSKSDCNEKLSASNGLLLCPNHDKLFDQGYISFEDNGSIVISPILDENNRIFFNINKAMKINPDILSDFEQMKYFLSYHHKNIFQK